MNALYHGPTDPWESLSENLLADVAVKIELPPSQYRQMLERKDAIERHLQREGSPLKGMVEMFYPQGSVAIGATIKSKRHEGFDIDIVAELRLGDAAPAVALDTLYNAMRGEAGSRYYRRTKRQSRCVTVDYEDEMHIDITPSVLLDASDPRLSHIFHAKPEESRALDKRIVMNSFAFAELYNQRCPKDTKFEREYGRRALAQDIRFKQEADADSLEAPPYTTIVGGKSATTVALQLLKRYKVLRWLQRNRRGPASVMLTSLALEVAHPGRTIGESLKVIGEHVLARLLQANDQGQLIRVANPRCPKDIFTDRWPADLTDQGLMIQDMQRFLKLLGVVLDGDAGLEDKGKALAELFGEPVAGSVLEEAGKQLGRRTQSGRYSVTSTGGISLGTSATAAKAKPRHTFYGGAWPAE